MGVKLRSARTKAIIITSEVWEDLGRPPRFSTILDGDTLYLTSAQAGGYKARKVDMKLGYRIEVSVSSTTPFPGPLHYGPTTVPYRVDGGRLVIDTKDISWVDYVPVKKRTLKPATKQPDFTPAYNDRHFLMFLAMNTEVDAHFKQLVGIALTVPTERSLSNMSREALEDLFYSEREIDKLMDVIMTLPQDLRDKLKEIIP